MRREWAVGNLSYSTLTEGLRSPIYIQPSRGPSRSNQRSVDHSRDKKIISYQDLDKFARPTSYKPTHCLSMKDMPETESKECGCHRQLDVVVSRVRELEGRMMQSEHRVNSLERNNKKTVNWTVQVEEFMKTRYPETKMKDILEERMATFEQALGHMSTIKADRKQLESIQIGRYYGLTERCNELQRQGERVNGEIAEINAKYQRMIGKIENSFLTMNQKYEEFIETSFIQTIDRVNNVAKHYNEKIQLLDRNMNLIIKKVEQLDKVPTRGETKQHTVWSQLIGLSLPHIRLIQTISVREERKVKATLNGFKEHIKEQHKEATPLMLNESGSTLNSETSLNNSLDNNNIINQVLFQRVVYKLDRDFNLLDENEHYIMTSGGKRIQLSAGQIAMLRENGLFV